MENFNAILFDLEGTLYIDKVWIDGALELIDRLSKQKEIPFGFLTNTTITTRKDIVEKFQKQGLKVTAEQFFTPLITARSFFCNHLKENDCIYPLIPEKAKPELSPLRLVNNADCQVVLVGEMGLNWGVEKINPALQALLQGAELYALHINRYYKGADGFHIGPGAIVSALEYASGKKCRDYFGKPQTAFFQNAVKAIGAHPQSTLVVGDDLLSDVQGAIKAGLRGAIVKTGKCRPEDLEIAEKEQIPTLNSVKDLLRMI
jgi:HAD superfamily hydrolase (TIGR01458 family)